MNKRVVRYRDCVLRALFTAIIFVLGMTPLGMIPLGLIKATSVHIPVIIGALVLGPKYGAVLGGVFGLVSLISNTVQPAALSFAFSPVIPVYGTSSGSWLSLIICFVPRVLVGVLPYYVFKLVQKLFQNHDKAEYLSCGIAGVVGAVVNTGLVMSLIYFLFKDAYATMKEVPVDAVAGVILGVVLTNGVAEAIIAGVLVSVIGKVLLNLKRKQKA